MSVPTDTTRRRLLAGIPATAAVLVPVAATALGGPPVQLDDDPIFAAIAEHRAALAAWDDVIDDDDDDEEVFRLALSHQNDALKRLFTTAPTTVAGAAAWLEYITEPEDPEEPGGTGTPIVFAIGEYNESYRQAVVPQYLAVAAVLREAELPAANMRGGICP
jgi:hypothetical protein